MTELFDKLNLLLAPVYAQAGAVSTNVEDPFKDRITNLQTLFGFVINLVLSIGLSLVIVMLALGFMQYIISRGDKVAIEKAQQWVTFAAIGGVGLFLVFAAKSVIESIVGAKLNTGSNTMIETTK